MKTRAQGTIEYLVIIAVIVIIGLVVVSLVTSTFDASSSGVASTSSQLSTLSGPIAVLDAVVDENGVGYLRLQNNSGEVTSITKITVGGKDVTPKDNTSQSGDAQGFVLDEVDSGTCSCKGFAGQKIICLVVISRQSSFGISKESYSINISVDCIENIQISNTGSTVQPKIQAVCGDSNGLSFSLAPSLGLCQKGSASNLAISSAYFDWNCYGDLASASCKAPRLLGAGTLGDPKMICACPELQAIGDYSSQSFKLCKDIDCYADTRAGGVLYNSGAGFDPFIGFSGNFDGNGRVISGLMINRPLEIQVALFGHALHATISNVGVEDVNVIGGSSFVAGLIGYNDASTVSASHVTGKINAINGTRVGGLVGYDSYSGGSFTGNITDCYSSADVNASGYVGGLVGFMEYGPTISRSYSSGDVNGTASRVGGLVGDNHAGTITNCYATGDVTGAHTVGGLVGDAYASSAYTYNSYATGKVTSTDTSTYSYAGGLIGRMSGYPSVARCFSTGSVTAYYPSGWVGGLTSENGAYLSLSNDYWFDNLGDSAINCFNNGNTNCTKIDGSNGGMPWFYYDTNGPMSLWGTWSNVSGTQWRTADNVWSICRGTILPWLTWENRTC
ncbi:MAG: GLUG motif-containing protein [archaeon]